MSWLLNSPVVLVLAVDFPPVHIMLEAFLMDIIKHGLGQDWHAVVGLRTVPRILFHSTQMGAPQEKKLQNVTCAKGRKS